MFRLKFSIQHFSFLISLGIIIFLLLQIYSFDLKTENIWLPKIDMSDEIIVLAIDEPTIDYYKSWPAPRADFVEDFNKILNYKPKVLGFDIFFQKSQDSIADAKLEELLGKKNVFSVKSSNSMNSLIQLDKEAVSADIDTYQGYVYDYKTQINDDITIASSLYKYYTNQSVYKNFILNSNTKLPLTISLKDLLQNPNVGSIITNKIVLVGGTSSLLSDFFSLPKLGYVPGVYVHAIAINQMLKSSFPQLAEQNIFGSVVYQSFVYVILIAFWERFNKYNLAVIFVNIGLILLGFFLTYYNLLRFSIFLSTVILTLGYSIFHTFVNLNKQKQELKKVLRGHLSPSVLTKVMNNPELVKLGGENYFASILFTDIRGFTAFSEKTSPDHVGSLLNKVLGFQADIVMQNEGVLDKYIGDSVMAFWGAPIKTKNHGYYALKTACEIRLKLVEINKNLGTDLQLGSGINSGKVIVGNFGSEKRYNYTTLGDAVNIASRLEGLTKVYGSPVLLTNHTIKNLKPEQLELFKILEIDTIVPKGKFDPIKIYEVIEYKTKNKWQKITTFNESIKYSKALKYYYKGDFKKAREIFKTLKSIKSKFMLERVIYLENNKPTSWLGIWQMQTK